MTAPVSFDRSARSGPKPRRGDGAGVSLLDAEARLEKLRDALGERARLENVLGELNARLLPWHPAAIRTRHRSCEQQLGRMQSLVARRIVEAREALERVLCENPRHTKARALLADLHFRLLSIAEERRDLEAAKAHLAELGRLEDDRYVDLIEGTATVEVDSQPAGARVWIAPVRERGGRRELGERTELGITPLGPVDLRHGDFVLELRAAGSAKVMRPITVPRGGDLRVWVTLPSNRQVGPNFVVVPAGKFSMGGDLGACGAGPRAQVFVDNFAIARCPVTCGEYLLFLDELAVKDPGKALRCAQNPRTANDDPRLPVVGISYEAAEAYAALLSARTGISHRLPTDAEWEKAARSGDGRTYAWGERFDATACCMRYSRPTAPARAPVGSNERDMSVYGVCDLSGGVSEWTSTVFDGAPELQVVRGGSYEEGVEACRLARRLGLPPSGSSAVGFRLVRPLPSGGGDHLVPATVPANVDGPGSLAQPRASPLSGDTRCVMRSDAFLPCPSGSP